MKVFIDGHNLIGQMPNLSLADPDDEAKLLEHLRRYRSRTGHSLTVFFDPGAGYRAAEKKGQGGITVQFAPHGLTADRLIIRRLRGVKNPQEVIVVSSDREVQQAARQARVRVLTSQEFSLKLFASPGEIEEEAGTQADVSLSDEEVQAWLALFKRRKKR